MPHCVMEINKGVTTYKYRAFVLHLSSIWGCWGYVNIRPLSDGAKSVSNLAGEF